MMNRERRRIAATLFKLPARCTIGCQFHRANGGALDVKPHLCCGKCDSNNAIRICRDGFSLELFRSVHVCANSCDNFAWIRFEQWFELTWSDYFCFFRLLSSLCCDLRSKHLYFPPLFCFGACSRTFSVNDNKNKIIKINTTAFHSMLINSVSQYYVQFIKTSNPNN